MRPKTLQVGITSSLVEYNSLSIVQQLLLLSSISFFRSLDAIAIRINKHTFKDLASLHYRSRK